MSTTGIGEALRQAREAQGRTLEDAAYALRARVVQLDALEEERFDDFGGDVYAKGFLKSYAIELGVDPAPLLETYRREVGHDDPPAAVMVTPIGRPPRQRSVPPAWIAWVLVAVIVVAGLGFLGTIGGGRTPEVAAPQEPTGSPPPPAEEDVDESTAGEPDTSEPGASDDASSDEEAEEPVDEPEPEFDGVDLLLSLERDVWMRVIVDGSVVLERTVPAGETLPFEGEQEIEVRFGDAGGVRAQLNGEDLGAQGARGEVSNVVFTPEGSQTP